MSLAGWCCGIFFFCTLSTLFFVVAVVFFLRYNEPMLCAVCSSRWFLLLVLPADCFPLPSRFVVINVYGWYMCCGGRRGFVFSWLMCVFVFTVGFGLWLRQLC
jgi:hypothetical protein